MIPKDTIEEIRERASIVEVVSRYVELRKRGANYTGLCPFHTEKTASFTVNEDKKLFHCFGCQATGSVFDFLMKHDGLDFPEAARSLARSFGVTIVEEKGGRGAQSKGPSPVDVANKTALDFFVGELKEGGGEKARSYLKERGYGIEVADDFRLGYAPDGWDGLLKYLKSKGVETAAAEKAGLIVKKDKGGYYDRFRDRLIFPITDVRGKVIAFGGRAFGDAQPKYLNSPESAVFKKGEVLYGLYKARPAISKEGYVIVVEGYFDLIALHAAGFINVVATMGTALTGAHVERVKNYARSGGVYTLFDGDAAGRKATLRGLDLFLLQDVKARVITLADGVDPDDFIKEAGPDGMKKAVKDAVPLFGFYLSELRGVHDLKTADGKGDFLNDAIAHLIKIKNVAVMGHWAGEVARLLSINVKSVYGALEAVAGGRGSKESKPAEAVKGRIKKGTRKAEATLLTVLLKKPELLTEEAKHALTCFDDPFFKKVAELVIDAGPSLNPSALLDSATDDEVKGWIGEALMKGDKGFVEEAEKMAEDCIKKVLTAGKPKEATMRVIEKLREGGYDVDDEIKGKPGTDSSNRRG